MTTEGWATRSLPLTRTGASKPTSGQKQLGAPGGRVNGTAFQVRPPDVDNDSEQLKRGESVRSATATTAGRVGSTATAGELWVLMPGRSLLTTPPACTPNRA